MAESGLNESLLPLLVLRPPTDPIEEPSFGLEDILTPTYNPGISTLDFSTMNSTNINFSDISEFKKFIVEHTS